MNGAFVTFRKELQSYCYSPVSYLIAVVFYLWHGALVTNLAKSFASAQADRELFPTYSYGLSSTFFMVLLVPGILTMRCFAEERRSGSIEMLMTAPVRDLGVVLGKWFAAVTFFLLLWLPTVLLLWLLTWSPFLNADLAFGPVFAAYLGMFLLSALLLSFGCFASSLTDNLLLAAILAILFNVALLQVPSLLRGYIGDPKEHPYLAQLVDKLDVNGNFQQWFARGLIDTSQIWFYVGATTFFLFLCVQSFSARRVENRMQWRTLGSWFNLALSATLMLAVAVLLVWLGERPRLRTLIDMTPGQRASVDPVTQELLRGLLNEGVKVEIHAFLTPVGGNPQDEYQAQRLRIFQRLQELTRVLLRQYDFLGGDAVQVFLHDQNSDPNSEREAHQRFGTTDPDVVVVSVQLPGKAARTRKLSLEGDFAVLDLPELKQSNLPVPGVKVPILKDFKGELALSSALKGLLVQGAPVIYMLNGNSLGLSWLDNTGDGYGQLHKMLIGNGFDVKELNLTISRGVVPKDASLVMVMEPRREFADTEVRALTEYLNRGGRLFLGYSFSGNPDWNSDGGALGRALGFQLGREPVFHRVNDGSSEGFDGSRKVQKLDLMVNQKHPITQRIWLGQQLLQFDAARELILRTDAPKGLRREELLSTGGLGWLAIQKQDGDWDLSAPRIPNALRPITVGMTIELDGTKTPESDKAPTGIAVVTSGVFCNNMGISINGDLALNICNWLTDRRVLLDIRGSGYKATYLQMNEAQSQRVKWLLVVFAPGTFLLLGVAMFFIRRRI